MSVLWGLCKITNKLEAKKMVNQIMEQIEKKINLGCPDCGSKKTFELKKELICNECDGIFINE